jgi:hypothetical protein
MAVRISTDLGLHIDHALVEDDDEMAEEVATLRTNLFWAVCTLDTSV